MRVNSINSYYSVPKTRQITKRNAQANTLHTNANVNFTGKGSFLGALVGGGIGFLLGGPFGAAAGAALCGVTSSAYDGDHQYHAEYDTDDYSGRGSLTGI